MRRDRTQRASRQPMGAGLELRLKRFGQKRRSETLATRRQGYYRRKGPVMRRALQRAWLVRVYGSLHSEAIPF